MKIIDDNHPTPFVRMSMLLHGETGGGHVGQATAHAEAAVTHIKAANKK